MWEDLKRSWASGSILYRLIYLNIAVFLTVSVVTIFIKDEGLLWLESSPNLKVLVERPWSVATYMFVHGNLWHLIVNMLPLWWFGRMYQAEVGSRKLLSTYVMGGLAGVATVILAVNYLGSFEAYANNGIVGASAAVFGIMTAMASLHPNRKVNFVLFGTVQLQHIVIGIIIMDYFARRNHDLSAMIGHLGGAFMGFSLVHLNKRGVNLSAPLEWMFDAFMSLIPTGGGKRFKVKRSNKFSSSQHVRPKSDDQFNSERKENSNRVDAILDKISRHGYDHLSKEEKEFLFKQSKK